MFCSPFVTSPTWGEQSVKGTSPFVGKQHQSAREQYAQTAHSDQSGSEPKEDETCDTFISIKDGRSLELINTITQPPSGSQVPPEQTGC